MSVKRLFLFLAPLLVILLSYDAARALFAIKPSVQEEQIDPALIPPDIHFYDKSNHRVTLKDFKGKVVLLNLWATWCPPCVEEMPALDRLQAMLPQDQFRVVAISVDRSSRKVVDNFMRKNGIGNLDAYWDQDRQVPLKWDYEALPTTYLIDRRGAIIARYDGAYDWDREPLLGEIRNFLR